MTRSLKTVLIAFLLLGAVSTAKADQLAWISHDSAKAAATQLKPGTLFVQWVSHMKSDSPQLYRVESVIVVKVADDYSNVVVEAKPVAASAPNSPDEVQVRYFFQQPPYEPKAELELDLAYVYVASSEVPGMFVNLGKKMGLEADVRSVAVQIPAKILELVQPSRETAQSGLSDLVPGGN